MSLRGHEVNDHQLIYRVTGQRDEWMFVGRRGRRASVNMPSIEIPGHRDDGSVGNDENELEDAWRQENSKGGANAICSKKDQPSMDRRIGVYREQKPNAG